MRDDRTKIDALFDLAIKVNGTASKEETVVDMIDNIAENYTGGGESGGGEGITVVEPAEPFDIRTAKAGLYRFAIDPFHNPSIKVSNSITMNVASGLLYVVDDDTMSPYIYFEVYGTEGASMFIHYGISGGKDASHYTFQVNGTK